MLSGGTWAHGAGQRLWSLSGRGHASVTNDGLAFDLVSEVLRKVLGAGERLTCTVVGSGQPNRQDSCQEKAVPSYGATSSAEPTSPVPVGAVGGEQGQRPRHSGSGAGEPDRGADVGFAHVVCEDGTVRRESHHGTRHRRETTCSVTGGQDQSQAAAGTAAPPRSPPVHPHSAAARREWDPPNDSGWDRGQGSHHHQVLTEEEETGCTVTHHVGLS